MVYWLLCLYDTIRDWLRRLFQRPITGVLYREPF